MRELVGRADLFDEAVTDEQPAIGDFVALVVEGGEEGGVFDDECGNRVRGLLAIKVVWAAHYRQQTDAFS